MVGAGAGHPPAYSPRSPSPPPAHPHTPRSATARTPSPTSSPPRQPASAAATRPLPRSSSRSARSARTTSSSVVAPTATWCSWARARTARRVCFLASVCVGLRARGRQSVTCRVQQRPHPTPPHPHALTPPQPFSQQVYKAFLYGVHPVAVKVFQTQDDVPADDFWKEISILRTCRHGNIVQFQARTGSCWLPWGLQGEGRLSWSRALACLSPLIPPLLSPHAGCLRGWRHDHDGDGAHGHRPVPRPAGRWGLRVKGYTTP